MNEERQEIYKILELGTDEKNLHKHKNTGGLLYIDLSMIKFSNLSTYIRKQDKEIERLNNIINEFEKDFERKIQSCTIEAETTTNDFYCRLHIATLKKWLNKIQELKGEK